LRRFRAIGQPGASALSTPKCAHSKSAYRASAWWSISPGLGRIDTSGAWLLERLIDANRARGVETLVNGQSKAAATLLDEVERSNSADSDVSSRKQPNVVTRFFEAVGRRMYSIRDVHLGATIRGGQMKLGRGHCGQRYAIFNQIDRMGVGAIPVVLLMSAIVGAIIAQQGAFQLRYFGADIFVVDLVGILVLRELGVLMTAIMIAGRSRAAPSPPKSAR
jgi:phospholipid/cholesterol/gamma-HCH transport system permease protein